MDNANGLKDLMQEWFEQIIERFDRLDKFIEITTSRHNILNGEKLLDNHDLCQLLNVSKRTLQRYRSNGYLPYQMIYHKTYYKESDVEKFILDHFSKNNNDKEKDELVK